MANDNIAVLTQSHSAIAAKKRAKHAQIKEIVFDEEARRTFLTGFHKRKVARREEARKKAQLREKQERLETRREHRRALAERAARNAAEVERACGALADDEWDGVSGEPDAMEEAYEGEEQLATVTVIQDFDPSVELYEPAEVKGAEKRKRRRTDKVKYETKVVRRGSNGHAGRKKRIGRAGNGSRA